MAQSARDVSQSDRDFRSNRRLDMVSVQFRALIACVASAVIVLFCGSIFGEEFQKRITEKLERDESAGHFVFKEGIESDAKVNVRASGGSITVHGGASGHVTLEAPKITFVGHSIENYCKVTLRASGGSISFTQGCSIEGTPVILSAPGGSIDFDARSCIGSDALLAEADRINLGNIDGKALVLAIVHKGGKVQWRHIDGYSKLLWCKAHDKDPQPTVVRGTIEGDSQVKQISRADMDALVKKHKLVASPAWPPTSNPIRKMPPMSKS
jgi:hypothetical protein